MLSQVERRVEETKEYIPFPIRGNPLTEPSSSSWDSIPEQRNFSLFGTIDEEKRE